MEVLFWKVLARECSSGYSQGFKVLQGETRLALAKSLLFARFALATSKRRRIAKLHCLCVCACVWQTSPSLVAGSSSSFFVWMLAADGLSKAESSMLKESETLSAGNSRINLGGPPR